MPREKLERGVLRSPTIWPYERPHVLSTCRRLPRGRRGAGNSDCSTYEEDERFWLVDDRGHRWMNLLKAPGEAGSAQPQLDTVRCVQISILWPMAQLLRARGLYLVPAAAVRGPADRFLSFRRSA